MSNTEYMYNISIDTLNGSVNSDKLKLEINNAYISAYISVDLDYINTNGENAYIWMSDALSAEDEEKLNYIVADHDGVILTIPEKKYNMRNYQNGKIQNSIWFEGDNGDGTYYLKSEETIYSYQGNKLINRIDKMYYNDGTEASSKTWNYYSDGDKLIEKEG